ncbi:MAG: SH3 domain-containing protein [Candidatus Omnitrophica bacterium]|nr:SH3 domain-containing protein [Candidatus Omnitrophota bacterium]
MGVRFLSSKAAQGIICILILYRGISLAQEKFPFVGQINSDNINIRADSTVASALICNLKKKTRLEAVGEYYEWYKVRIPKDAPCYIRKDMVECITKIQGQLPVEQINNRCLTGKVIKDNVNLRLGPTQKSPVLGQANRDEVVIITGEKDVWYKIIPTNNTFGWINKKFLDKIQQ